MDWNSATQRLRPLSVSLAAAAILTGCNIAPEDLPWTPLALEEPIGWATRMKLASLRDDPAQCRSVLASAARLKVRDAALDAGTDACPLADAVAIEASTLAYGGELAASCPLAAAIYVWEREVVQPAARWHLRSTVLRIDTLGTFACRNVYGRAAGRLSEHASANAIDVAGFRLEDGRRISVLNDWSDEGAEAAFLRDVRDGSCALFSGVFGPEYNEAHADHLHLDMGRYRICS